MNRIGLSVQLARPRPARLDESKDHDWLTFMGRSQRKALDRIAEGELMSSQPTDASTGASLQLKLVGEITGRFVVARYQRGYRWGKTEVECLLDDIHGSEGKPYSLQPVVVSRRRRAAGNSSMGNND